ncbi:hypothetical protein BT63DRAFT_442934 [Microthyrium microscopicum]|uniref:Glycoside hydrolase n=1 Tax=Microthyrium microscopicum TaxID=703497 RepID=A0A6A6U2B0_9PEZI|nr:hypothetical protein BT63DRAFT_442934 [Microthyrium microscopicum]
MVVWNLIPLLALVGNAFATAYPPKNAACAKLDIVFTGLPPYHPLVVQQGFNSSVIDATLRADAANIIKAGYNLRVVLMGPEQNLSVLAGQMEGNHWDGTGIGYGVRGAHLPELTIRLEDIIKLYHSRAPNASLMFDYSSDSALWAIKRRVPLASNCTDSPGKDLGFNVFCDIYNARLLKKQMSWG